VLFLSTPPVETALDQIYTEKYQPYAVAKRRSRTNDLTENVLRLLNIPQKLFARRLADYYAALGPGNVFLDFGCGAGDMLNRMRKTGCKTIGMDFSVRALEVARSKGHLALPANEDGWSAVDDDSVDFVRMNHVLEHLYRPAEVLKHVHQKMRPGARLHIAVPNPDGISAKLYRRHWHGLDCPRHVILFPPRVLVNWLGDLGFRVRRLLYEPLTKDLIRSQALARRDAQVSGATNVDELMFRPIRVAAALMPVLVATLAGFPDRFHVIAER
jgi:SAM-dependent methyltransferase